MLVRKQTGQPIDWQWEQDKRLKRIHIRVHPQEGVIVRTPVGTPAATVRAVVSQRTDWLRQRLSDLARHCPFREYNDGETLPYLGREVTVHIDPGDRAASWQGLDIYLSHPHPRKFTRDEVRQQLVELYRCQAGKFLPQRVERLNDTHFRHRIQNIRVKSQASVLASCSSLGNLNFNWRLLLAPLPVVDYVVIHELAHMVEMNHSAKFWKVVEGACPQYRKHRNWLRQNSCGLYI